MNLINYFHLNTSIFAHTDQLFKTLDIVDGTDLVLELFGVLRFPAFNIEKTFANFQSSEYSRLFIQIG